MISKTVASHHFAMETEAEDVAINHMLHRVYGTDFNIIAHQRKEKRSIG